MYAYQNIYYYLLINIYNYMRKLACQQQSYTALLKKADTRISSRITRYCGRKKEKVLDFLVFSQQHSFYFQPLREALTLRRNLHFRIIPLIKKNYHNFNYNTIRVSLYVCPSKRPNVCQSIRLSSICNMYRTYFVHLVYFQFYI